MTPKEISQSYDALASHWNGEQFTRANGIAQHERALRFVEQADNALDRLLHEVQK